MTSNVLPDIENLTTLFDKQIGLTNDEQTKSSNVPFHRSLTVSTLAHYFGLQCDEYLRLSLNSPDQFRNAETLKDSLTKQRGIQFESDIKSFYSSSILSSIFNETQFLTYLRSSLDNPRPLSIGYNIKFRWNYDDNLQSNYKPDFLLIETSPDNRLQITIVDAKSSARLRIEHCVQVALYAMDLRVWIERHHLDERIFINDFGQIWLPSDDRSILFEKKIFPLKKLQNRLGDFLQNDLKKILIGNEWMMLPRCSMCYFASRCRQRAIYTEPTSMNNLSYLSRSNYSLIRSFFGTTDVSMMDLRLLLEPIQSEDQRRLQDIFLVNHQDHSSQLVKAIDTHEPQLKDQTSFLIPKINDELLLLVLFIIPNPSQLHSLTLFSSNIYDLSKQNWIFLEPIIRLSPKPSDVVLLIAEGLEKLREYSPRPCQIIVFDEQEKSNLFDQLTLASDNEHIDRCLTLLSSSENAILLEHPPDVIQTDRFYRVHPLSNISKDEIKDELFHRYGSTNNNQTSKAELTQQLKQFNDKEQEMTRENLIGLPALISLHTAIRQSFVIPMPGYFDLEDLKYSFGISFPSSNPNEILQSISKDGSNGLTNLVQQRLNVLSQLYRKIQHHLDQSARLQLKSSSLPQIQPINSSHPHIRRLIFLRQYEMFFSLRSIQQSRFDLNDSPILIRVQQKITNEKSMVFYQCQIERGQELISKNFIENSTTDFRTYSYLISKDNHSIRTFSDAVYMDAAIDGIRTRIKFDQYGLANIEPTVENETILIRVKFCGFPLEINEQYHLNERYVDFNTKKAIQGLEQATSLTIQILDDPRQLKRPEAVQRSNEILQRNISNMFSKREPSIKPSGLHLLNKAQQNACEKVKNERITLIWGPPGTGKTYWSSVTVFQMLMFSLTPLRILITACTHTAIDNLLFSINRLKELFASSPQFPQWYRLAQDLLVLKIDSKNYRSLSSSYKNRFLVIGSTVWTLQKLDPHIVFDIIFVDESTQLLTSDAVLAINRLADHDESRLIVAGDPLQLPPIKRCVYPPLPHPTPDLFSSLFHCLLRDEYNQPISLLTEKPFEQISRCPYLAVFDENHRMNEQLSDFTRLLYGEHYRQGRSRTLLSIRSSDSSHSHILGSLLDPYNSLYTILVDSPSLCSYSRRSVDVELESHLVYSLVDELVSRISPSSIFLITPHRMQRSSIQRRLAQKPFPTVQITCDTVERMQGKEAQCVILCMLYREHDILVNELDFIYNRQRINVSITRAQQLCILLTSQLLFNRPPLDLFIHESTRNAYNLLNNFVNKSSKLFLDCQGNVK